MSSSRTQPKFGDGSWMEVDGSGKLAWFSKNGTEIFSVDTSGNITGITAITATGALTVVGITNTGASTLGSTGQFVINASGLPTKSNNIALAGQGYPLIVAAPATNVGAVAAITNFINFTPPATSGQLYLLHWSVDVTTSTTHNFTVQATFKEEQGGALTQNIGGFNTLGAVLASGAIVNAQVGVFYGSMLLGIDNSATAITLSTVGTFTTVVYNLDAVLLRLK